MKCVCCDKFIKCIHEDMSQEDAVFTSKEGRSETIKAENRMWLDGVIGNISAGYGSVHDGDMFVIAICDKCIKEKKDTGVLAYTGNYMFKGEVVQQDIDKYRKIWRRNNNLDELL